MRCGAKRSAYILDLLEESLLNEPLMEEKSVVVDNIDKVGARCCAARACQLLRLGRILSTTRKKGGTASGGE